MIIEEARRIANSKFTELIQPLIDGKEVPSEVINDKVEQLKADLKEEVGFEVAMFYVDPIGPGMFEITTVFKTGEKRR